MKNINKEIQYHSKAMNAYTRIRQFARANYHFEERNKLISQKIMNERLAELTEKLSEYGIVQVIKDDYVFTLYMINDVSFFNAKTVFKILGIIQDYTEKKTVEVMNNEENYILIVLKP